MLLLSGYIKRARCGTLLMGVGVEGGVGALDVGEGLESRETARDAW